MYNLLSNLFSCQSIPFPFRICLNWSNLQSDAFFQSTKHSRSSLCTSSVHSDIIFSIPVVHYFSCKCSKAVAGMITAFVALGFFCKNCNLSGIHGSISSFMYVGELCHYSETIFPQQFDYTPRYIIISCSFLVPHFLDSFFCFTLQNVRALHCMCFLFRLNFRFSD